MTDGLILPPGAGRPVQGGDAMTLKVGAEHTATWSAFETSVAPGFDVGAHWHRDAEELFYILDGELDLLAFEPESRASQDWTTWESASGMTVTRGGPGSFMYVPAGCPHAFTNPGSGSPRLATSTTSPNSARSSPAVARQARRRLFRHRLPDCAPAGTSSSSRP
jgi:oxalate decarboxylase/phosphoglucose isomerase-like protein (cupin superfamily)